MCQSFDKHRIPLESASNIRDLSGYRTGSEGVTSDAFIRGDSFAVLTGSDIRTLLGLGVTAVIDLRNGDEIAKVPSAFARCEAVNYKNIPLLSDDKYRSMNGSLNYLFIMGEFYISIVESSGEQLRQVFYEMAHSSGKLLFHCSAGKDRTGIITALLLKLAGVDDETVIYDYCLSEEFLKEKLQSLKIEALASGIEPADSLDELLGAKAHNMLTFLKHISDKYADAGGYLKAINLNPTEILMLKKKLIAGEISAWNTIGV